jgi:hypothetical protein
LQNPPKKSPNHPSARTLFDSLTSPFSVPRLFWLTSQLFLVTSRLSIWPIYQSWMWWKTLLKHYSQTGWMLGRFVTTYQILEISAARCNEGKVNWEVIIRFWDLFRS